MSEFLPIYKKLLRDPVTFARHASRLTLRNYQRGVIESIFDSVINRRGMAFVVLFPRQSGKNELQAQLEVYLLTLFSQLPGGDDQGQPHAAAAGGQRHAPGGKGAAAQLFAGAVLEEGSRQLLPDGAGAPHLPLRCA